MFKNTYQSGFLSVLYSVGSKPLALWDKTVKNGHIRRITDEDVRSLVIEIMGCNVATTFISCPLNPRQTLAIKLPFFVMIVKNMKKYFTFEIQILDDKNLHRRFRVSNFQSTTRVRPFCTTMPIGLSAGWNQIQFNLADFTKRAYGTNYIETTRIHIHANIRIRRIYFSDRLYSEDEMPQDFKLFLPTGQGRQSKVVDQKSKEKAPKTKEASTVETVKDDAPPGTPTEQFEGIGDIPEVKDQVTEEEERDMILGEGVQSSVPKIVVTDPEGVENTIVGQKSAESVALNTIHDIFAQLIVRDDRSMTENEVENIVKAEMEEGKEVGGVEIQEVSENGAEEIQTPVVTEPDE